MPKRIYERVIISRPDRQCGRCTCDSMRLVVDARRFLKSSNLHTPETNLFALLTHMIKVCNVAGEFVPEKKLIDYLVCKLKLITENV